MRRKIFTYNPESISYEPLEFCWKRFFKRTTIFFTICFLSALLSFYWYNQRFTPLQEQFLQQVNVNQKLKWSELHERITDIQNELKKIAHTDDTNYRVILDLPAMSEDERDAGSGGSQSLQLADVIAHPFIENTYSWIEKLTHQLDIQQQSLSKLLETAEIRQTMWASRPAIQPINNKKLNRLHTTYGMRMHPVFNTVKDHKGLDFSAPRGTPVYASGDGRISMAYFSGSYGNVIYIDHGFDFETRYAHLYRFNVRQGEFVKRGQLIGYVGNTGISAAPHLHYEVLFKGNHINPINFFQHDLNNSEYEKLIMNTSDKQGSLD